MAFSDLFSGGTMSMKPYDELNAGGKIGLALQSLKDPMAVQNYRAMALAEQERRDKEAKMEALKQLSQDMMGETDGVPNEAGVMGPVQLKDPISQKEALIKYAGITGDYSGLFGIGARPPAALQVADELAAARASGDKNRINDILLAGKLTDKGVIYNSETGMYEDAAGYGGALGSLGRQENYGGESGTLQAQRDYKPQVMQAEYLQEGFQKLPALQRALQSKELSESFIQPKIDSVLARANEFNTGFGGAIGSLVPGSPAYDLKVDIDTLLANAGFDKLQQMRDNSPTGGALGQVSERELALLQAAQQAIYQSQTKEQLQKNLKAFQEQRLKSLQAVREAYIQDYERFGGKRDPNLPTPEQTFGKYQKQPSKFDGVSDEQLLKIINGQADKLNLSELEKQHGLPAGLLNAVLMAESAGDASAVSPKGAQGLFQFMPETAQSYGIDPFDPAQSASGAARMYADLSKQYGGNLDKMLAAYNWGSGNMEKYGLDNMPDETRGYIQKVSSLMQDVAPQFSKEEALEEAKRRGLTVNGKGGVNEFSREEAIAEAKRRGLLTGDNNHPQQQNSVQTVKQEQPGFLARMGRDINKRIRQGAETLQRDQGIAEDVFQLAGQGVLGFAGDTVGNVLLSGINYTPQPVKDAAGSALATIGKLPSFGGGTIGEKIPGELQMLSQKYDKFAEENPRAAANIESGVNIGSMLFAPTKAVGTGDKILDVGKKIEKIGSPAVRTADDLAEMSRKAYKTAEQAGGNVSAAATDDIINDVLNRIDLKTSEAKTIFPNQAKEIEDTLFNLIDMSGKPMTFQGIEEIDKILTLKKKNHFNPATGGLDEIGAAYDEIQDALREGVVTAIEQGKISGGPEAFRAAKEAKNLWSRRIKLQNIEDIIQRAERMDNPAKSFQVQVGQLLENKKKIRSYSKAERELLEKIVKLGPSDEILRSLGSRLGGIISLGTGNPLTGGALTVGAKTAREIGNARQLKKLNEAGQTIAYGGPPPKPSALAKIAKPVGQSVRLTGETAKALDSPALQKLMQIELYNQYFGEEK
jgi:hypothetical protein